LQMSSVIERRERQIAELADPSPGSTPYLCCRPINIPEACSGQLLIDAVTEMIPVVDRDEWLDWFDQGRIRDGATDPSCPESAYDLPVASPDQRVRGGGQFTNLFADTVEPDVNTRIGVVHEDAAIVVIDKPAPLPMHPSGRFNRNTLGWILDQVYGTDASAWPDESSSQDRSPAAGRLRPVHRLDANTSGLVLFARSKAVAAMIQQQFEHRRVAKRYLAKVAQRPVWDTHISHAKIGRQRGRCGHRTVCDDGQEAETELRVIATTASDETLILAIPKTGRTNQIRIHLWDAGHPICGETLYLPDGRLGTNQTRPLDSPPLCLHAWQLSLQHPLSQQTIHFQSPPPPWAT